MEITLHRIVKERIVLNASINEGVREVVKRYVDQGYKNTVFESYEKDGVKRFKVELVKEGLVETETLE